MSAPSPINYRFIYKPTPELATALVNEEGEAMPDLKIRVMKCAPLFEDMKRTSEMVNEIISIPLPSLICRDEPHAIERVIGSPPGYGDVLVFQTIRVLKTGKEVMQHGSFSIKGDELEKCGVLSLVIGRDDDEITTTFAPLFPKDLDAFKQIAPVESWVPMSCSIS